MFLFDLFRVNSTDFDLIRVISTKNDAHAREALVRRILAYFWDDL